ncbi:unnamed protein product [Microthlaspi erraticum]|uniref:C2H2-type domain-containing protein n=1 Tax=Microthlaspi erraticum TaxID=1685480 RepID=A0A6D2I5A0_9BRAS|nr:unnamed protein product [Microthlaspi erraticum]CAA7023513.1 unnamed protein product [Microthlaspi erraticum]
MSSLPISFNSNSGDRKNNQTIFTFMNQNSTMVRSRLTTPDHMNHGNSIPSPPSFTYHHQNSHASSSSSFRLNNSQMVKREMDSLVAAESIPIKDNPQYSQVSFTQTVTKKFSAVVPTSSIFNIHNDVERVQRALGSSQANVWNSTLLHPTLQRVIRDHNHEILNPEPLNVIYPHQNSSYMPASSSNPIPGHHAPQYGPSPQRSDMSASSSNPNRDHHVPQYGPSPQRSDMSASSSNPNRDHYVLQYGPSPQQFNMPAWSSNPNRDHHVLQYGPSPQRFDMPASSSNPNLGHHVPQHGPSPQHSDMFASSSNPNRDHHVPQYGPSPQQTNFPQETIHIIDSDEDEESGEGRYDGRTHSLPYEKHGPYTCPRCSVVCDTSQRFAAHMSFHYRNETNEERVQRVRARTKKKFRVLKEKIHEEYSKKIKQEAGVRIRE